MAGSFQWYINSVKAWLWDQNAQQAVQSETPWFNMFSNVNTSNVPWMDILSPTERQNQEYDQNAMRAEALNKEVEIWLWTRVDDVMSDAEKQYYLNHLNKSQYEQMLKYKNEWYWFMASKALMENSYKLADPNATWLMKYKDYAQKDAYYNNSLLMPWEAATTPTQQLADWWNERYSKNVTYWTKENWEMYVIRDDNNFWNRLANVSFGSLVNLFNTWVNGMMNIMDKWQSALWSALDKAILWIDTDSKFYRQSDTTLINDVAQTVGSAASLAALWLWVTGSPLGMAWITTLSATKPWGFLMDLTFWNLNKLVNRTLDKIDFKDYLNQQSLDSVSNAITLWITIWLAKVWWPKIQNSKIWAYSNTIKWMVKDWLQKGTEYAKVQADYENFAWTKKYSYIDWETWETWEFTTFEWYNPWYRWRVAKSFWEWFKEWVKDRFNNPNGTNLSERRNTTWQEWLQWTEPWADGSNKTATDSTQNNWKVNTFWAAQLRQWNKMNKNQWIKFANRYWTDYWTWMAQRWFNQWYDTNIQQLISYDEYMQQQKRNALSAVKQRYQDPDVLDMLNEAIERADYTKSEDLPRLLNLKKKYENWWLEMVDEDYVRQWFWYHFPLKFDWTDVAWVTQRNNNMYERVKNVLERQAEENWIPQLREINREIAATYHIIDWTTRYYNWVSTNDVMSLKDLITLASTVANPKARPIFVIQQSLKMPKVRDTILSKLIKGKTNEERTQIKIDFDKIRKIQDEAEQRRLLEEWIAKWNLKVEEATKAMQNRLPENITQWWVVAWDRGIVSTNPSSPTYQQMWLWTIRETASPQYLLRAIIEQLKESNLIKDIDTAEAINQILSNMSPEAQATLAEITRKLANWQPLTEKEWKIIEKIADIIRQDQDTITDVQQPWLFDWLDNWEPTDINNTNLPTNPTNNGGGITDWTDWISEWWVTEWWVAGWWDGVQLWASNWWWNQGELWEARDWLWEWEGEIWPMESKTVRVVNSKQYEGIKWNLIERDGVWISKNIDNFEDYKIFTSPKEDWLIAVDNDWNISEFIVINETSASDAWELTLSALESWANKVVVNDTSMVEYFENFWFKPVATYTKGWWRAYFMVHNWDSVEMVRKNRWWYEHNPKLWKLKDMSYWDAKQYMQDMVSDTKWYNITDVEWWDWVKNREDFNKKFHDNKEIRDYIEDKYRSLTNDAWQEQSESYDRELAETREIFNWHIDTKDIWVWYFKNENVLKRHYYGNKRKSINAVFDRAKVDISIWVSKWYTVSHETSHSFDYKFWKELLWRDIVLSDLADRLLSNKKIKRPENIDNKIAELIWDFVDIFRDIKKRGYNWYKTSYPNWKRSWFKRSYVNEPTERFARWWEAFVKSVRWWEPSNWKWENFTKKLSVDFAKWLGKLDIARQNWELYDWTLKPIDNAYENVSIDIPWVWKVDWLTEYYKG